MTRKMIRTVAFSSHVASGAVGNRAIVFALELLGFEVVSVQTIQMAWHPGHGPSTRLVPEDATFEAMVDDLAGRIDPAEPIAVLTGYLGSAAQAAPIARFVETSRAKGALVHYLCDPVIGDQGGHYVPIATAEAIRDQLMPLADIVTPNVFELGWLSGNVCAHDMADAAQQAKQLGVGQVLVTSVPGMMDGNIANLLVASNHTFAAEHRVASKAPNGTGDLIAALFLAQLLRGARAEQALGMASAAVFALVDRAARQGDTDFQLARDQEFLRRPTSMPVRTFVTTKPR